MTSKTVNVPSISCGHCVMTIEREIGELSGVLSVSAEQVSRNVTCLLYTSPSPRDGLLSRMPSSA